MKKPLILALTLISTSLQAQTYTQVQWGMNKGVTPYDIAINVNNIWYSFGFFTPGVGPGLYITSLAVNSAYNSEKQITVNTQPTYTFPEALGTEFAGDFSKTFLPFKYTINGTSLGQPTTGYQWSPAVTPVQSLVINNSGWNQATNSNTGRTGFSTYRSMVQQNGQGDAMPYYGFCLITAPQRAGATSWLANPACALMAANIGTTTDHTYMQGLGDISFTDSGKDVAVVADERGFFRTNNTAAFGEVWLGYLSQSAGSKNIDVSVAVNGPTNVGMDTVLATGLLAAVNMKADQKILLNSTATPLNGISWYGNNYGGSYLTHSSGASEVQIGYNNAPAAAFTASASATDYLLLGATGSAGAYLQAESSNANAGITYATKGTGSHFFKTGGLGGSINFAAVYTPSAVNYIQVAPSVTTAPTTISSNGSDTNIGVNISPKGTGPFTVNYSAFAVDSTGNVTTPRGFLASGTTGAFNGTYSSGLVMDYVAPQGRFSVSGSDSFGWYNGGIANTQLMTLSSGAALTIGKAATTTGTLALGGATSGTVTIAPQAAAGTYNFNLPTTAGTSGQPLLSGGGGSTAMSWGNRSGNTTTFGTTSGTLTNGHCVSIDASGNFVDAGGACTTGGGGGTVNAGTIGQLAYYASTGTAVSGSYSPTIGVAGTSAGSLAFANATSGSITLQPTTGALGTSVLTLPATTGTVTVLGNTTTGSGSIVLATSPSIASPTFTGTVGGAGTVPLSVLATQAANTVVGNATSGAASPTALSMTSCSTAGSAVSWTTNTGFGCNTSITAAAVPATGVTAGALGSTVTINNSNWSGTQLSLTNGGTNASLTASNGGIIYSTASALAVLSGTATANQHLASGASGAPSWTTATFPATTTAGTILTSGTANTVTASATPILGVNATTTGTLGLANGGATGATVTLQNNGATAAYNFNLPTTVGTAGYLLTSQAGGSTAMTWTSPTTTVNGTACTLGSTCTVTAAASSIAFPATVSGTVTSGGIPYFSSATAMSSSAVLAANSLVIGGGAGVAPATTTTGTGVVTAIGNNTNTNGGFVVPATALAQYSLVVGGGSGTGPSVIATGSSGQHLQSGGAAANPSWTTATFPAATTAGTILASGTANTVTATATPTLGVQSTTAGTLTLANTNAGAFPTTLASSTSSTAAWTLTLPVATPAANGAVLTSTTAGVSSWASTLPVANGGTNCSAASITCFNNITGFTAAGTTGTTSTNLVFSTSPTLVTPVLGAATGTSLALGGATIGTNALAVTGTAAFSGQISSSVATGTAPFSVASTTQVTNLNASQLQGYATGTSGGTIPLLNGANTWSANQTFNGTFTSFANSTAFTPQITILNTTNDANASYINFQKSRGAGGTNTVQVNDTVGTFIWQAYDSSATPILQNTSSNVSVVVDAVAAGSVTTHFAWAGQSQFTAGIASTSTTTGTLKVTGGIGLSGALWGGGIINAATSHQTAAALPTISACGTSPSATAGSNNNSGQITTGSTATTACTITFATAYPTSAYCTVSPQGAANSGLYISAQSASAFTITYTSATSAKFQYTCFGN